MASTLTPLSGPKSSPTPRSGRKSKVCSRPVKTSLTKSLLHRTCHCHNLSLLVDLRCRIVQPLKISRLLSRNRVVPLEEMQERVKADPSKHAYLPPMPATTQKIIPQTMRARAATTDGFNVEPMPANAATERPAMAPRAATAAPAYVSVPPIKRRSVPKLGSGAAAAVAAAMYSEFNIQRSKTYDGCLARPPKPLLTPLPLLIASELTRLHPCKRAHTRHPLHLARHLSLHMSLDAQQCLSRYDGMLTMSGTCSYHLVPSMVRPRRCGRNALEVRVLILGTVSWPLLQVQ